MNMLLDELKPGLNATVEIVVGTRDTAAHVGSGKIGVLATPILVTLLESAALQAVEGFMPPGQQTVGTRLDISHTAATPVGMRVRAHAELVKVDGRKLTFKLHAEDEGETIGGGVHERLVTPLDLLATIYHTLGIPLDTHYEDGSGRPVSIVGAGRPIHELV